MFARKRLKISREPQYSRGYIQTYPNGTLDLGSVAFRANHSSEMIHGKSRDAVEPCVRHETIVKSISPSQETVPKSWKILTVRPRAYTS